MRFIFRLFTIHDMDDILIYFFFSLSLPCKIFRLPKCINSNNLCGFTLINRITFFPLVTVSYFLTHIYFINFITEQYMSALRKYSIKKRRHRSDFLHCLKNKMSIPMKRKRSNDNIEDNSIRKIKNFNSGNSFPFYYLINNTAIVPVCVHFFIISGIST